MSSIPGLCIGVREKILATPSVGARGETHVQRNKCADWASSKKCTFVCWLLGLNPPLELIEMKDALLYSFKIKFMGLNLIKP